MKKTKQKILKFLLDILNIIFISLTLALVFIAVFKPGLVKEFLLWIKSIIAGLGSWNYLIAFGSATIESFPVIGVLVPGMQIMIFVGGIFGKIDPYNVVLLAIIGAMVGNYVGFVLGARYGDNFLKTYGEWFGLGKTELKILKKQIQKNGAWFIIFGKFHNFTRSFVPFIAGSMGMHQKHFWFYNIIGSIIWATTIIILGIFFFDHYETIVDNIEYIMLGLLGLIIVYIVIFKRKEFMEYIKEKNAEIDEKIEQEKLLKNNSSIK